MTATDKTEIGYDLKNKCFTDVNGEVVPEATVRELWYGINIDCTCMVYRLIVEFDWDGDKLQEWYDRNP